MAAKQPWFRHIDWMINWLGFLFLFLCIGLIYAKIEKPSFLFWGSNPATAWDHSGAIGIPILYVLMTIGCTLALVIAQPKEKKAFEYRKYIVGFSCVWGFTMLSKWIAAQNDVHHANIGDSIWAIFFGCVFYHVIKRLNKKLLHCLELAKQTELYIATSLVLLVINFDKLKTIIGNSIFVAWIDTPILFILFSYLGVKLFKLRPKQSMILTGCTVICGSSAATAIRNSLKGKEKDQKDSILISSLLTIPCIIILPIIGKAMGLSNDIAGSWFGGCVDSTGAVFATSTQFSQESTASGAVVKMVQNILIAPISVAIVAFYIKYQDSIDEIEVERTRTRSRLGSKQPQSQINNDQRNSRAGSKQPKNSRTNSKNKDEFQNKLTSSQVNQPEARALSINNRSENRALSINNRPENRALSINNVQENRTVSFKEQQKEGRAQSKKQDIQQPLIEKPKNPSYLTLIWERFPKFVLGFITSIIIFNVAVVSDKLEYGRDFIFCVSEWFSTCSFVSIGMSLQLAKGDGKQLIILTDILTTLGYAYVSFTYF